MIIINIVMDYLRDLMIGFYLDPVLDKLEESLVDEGRFLDSPELDAMLPT